MAQCCIKVTHLSLSRNLSLDHLEEIVHTMKYLKQLDVFVEEDPHIKSKSLAIALLEKIKQQGNSLPSVINVYVPWIYCKAMDLLLQFWSTWSFKLPSFEVGLYEIRRVPMSLYPSIPLIKFQFGPAAIPPLIKLTDHGILGLQYDTFHFTEYDHYGEIRHSITAQCDRLHAVKEHFNCISNLYSVSNADFCNMDICPGNLEQLATACPNLEKINLMNARNCLQNLKGLRAIVDKCKNLQGINLAVISISRVEYHLGIIIQL